MLLKTVQNISATERKYMELKICIALCYNLHDAQQQTLQLSEKIFAFRYFSQLDSTGGEMLVCFYYFEPLNPL